jgi:hypothetical protein
VSNFKAALSSSARTFFILKKWERASVEFEKILSEFGDDPLMFEQLSICYQNMNLPEKEKDCIEKSLKFTNPEKIDKINILNEKLKKFDKK